MPGDSTVLTKDMEAVAGFAIEHLSETCHRSPAIEVERLLAKQFGLGRRQGRAVIRHLVRTGELIYANEHGSSFLEPSFHRPVRIGARIVLVPADLPYRTCGQEVAVRIAPGASFGSGRHPTTRLALRGLEEAAGKISKAGCPPDSVVLDIGSGSGVLVIAAVKLGLGRGVGIDTDPCARWEARQNIQLNRLSGKIRVGDQPTDQTNPTGRFNFVAANLRTPTLMRLVPTICDWSTPSGRLVLSGIRTEEMDGLLNRYRAHGFHELWVAGEKGWVAIVLQRQQME